MPAQTHATHIELCEAVPSEVEVGDEIVLRVKVSCAAGCSLRGLPVTLTGPDGAQRTLELSAGNDAVSVTDAIPLTAPTQVGDHVWRVSFAPHDAGNIRHEASELSVRVTARPHGTSLAVWDVPSPVVMGERFAIKVGTKSSAAYNLKDHDIEVCAEGGAVVARGRLRETPWPGTTALYWTELELPAPAVEGLHAWSVRFAAADMPIPHEDASARFSVAIVKPPEHTLTVALIDKTTGAPIEDAHVLLGPYRAATDPSGRAEIRSPKGAYDLSIWKVGYEAPARAVEVNGNVTVRIEADAVPEDDPDAAWTM